MQIETLKLLLAGATSALLLMIGLLVGQHQPAPIAVGSVAVSNDYRATSTTPTIAPKPSLWSLTATSSTDLFAHQGTLGSFVVTGAGSAGGTLDIYDATTTNVNLRTGQMATSTILIASMPSNLAAGTYTYDVQYNVGLLIIINGTLGTTTITWRPNK